MTGTRKGALGWPQHKRIAHLLSLQEHTARNKWPVEFQGKIQQLSIYSVPVELPKYRLANGRTVSAQQEWVAKHGKADANLFSRDPELDRAQMAQHEILKAMIGGKTLLQYFRDPRNKQTEPVIVDSDGFVVNGNRRLCCWRELLASNPKKYSHFTNVEVALLPPCAEEDIDRLEAKLQLLPDIKEDYEWHARANMYKERMRQLNLADEEIAKVYGVDKKEVRALLDMLEEATQWLKQRSKPGQWSLASDKEYVFRPLVEKRRTLTAAGDKELYRAVVFGIINNDDAGGRNYQRVKDVHKHLPAIRDALLEEIKLPRSRPSTSSKGLLGGGTNSQSKGLQLAAALKKSQQVSIEGGRIALEVIESTESKERERKKVEGVLEFLRRANGFLQSALSAAVSTSKRKGVSEQVSEIRKTLAEIEKWAKAKRA